MKGQPVRTFDDPSGAPDPTRDAAGVASPRLASASLHDVSPDAWRGGRAGRGCDITAHRATVSLPRQRAAGVRASVSIMPRDGDTPLPVSPLFVGHDAAGWIPCLSPALVRRDRGPA